MGTQSQYIEFRIDRQELIVNRQELAVCLTLPRLPEPCEKVWHQQRQHDSLLEKPLGIIEMSNIIPANLSKHVIKNGQIHAAYSPQEVNTQSMGSQNIGASAQLDRSNGL